MHQRLAMLLSAAALAVACGQTDTGISTAVKSADDTVKAYQIDVDTSDKVVTLSGNVETATAKEQAVTLARGTDGVQDVVDRIVVDPRAAVTPGDVREEAREAQSESQAVLGDGAITAAVKAKLLADPDVSGLKIDVDTRAGIVTLTGNVNTRAEAEEAVTLARQSDGVKSVVNSLKVGR